jgi:KDO2-lipid IV(A) lauroyltransferase
MQRPRKPRKSRPADLEHRKPFERVPLWLRALAALPLPFWYRVADIFAWLAEYVVRYRRGVVDMQLRRCFPGQDETWIRKTRRGYYRNFGDVSVEIIKAVSITEDEIRKRVKLVDADRLRAVLDAGQSIIIVTSHNCNWEWALLAISIGLGHPVHAAYKPLHRQWGDRLFLTIRSRFGARMIPAKRLLMRVLRDRGQARIVAMVADQDPVSATVRHFTQFFGQDTAFYLGPEAISRVGKMPVYYLAMTRESRGHYEARFELLASGHESLPEGAIIDRFARQVEAHTRAHPSDWLWSYRRWKVRRQVGDGDGSGRIELTDGSD